LSGEGLQGNLEAAHNWLSIAFHAFPADSDEQKSVVAKQEQLRQLQSSLQMGTAPKLNLAALRTVVKQEIAKFQGMAVAK